AARTYDQHPGERVGQLEIGMARVEQERMPSFQLVREKRGETRVPSLRETRRDLGRLAFFGIEVDVEVLRFQHLEVERFVLHLVAAEVLRIRGRSMEQEDREHEEDAPSERSGCERHAGLPDRKSVG